MGIAFSADDLRSQDLSGGGNPGLYTISTDPIPPNPFITSYGFASDDINSFGIYATVSILYNPGGVDTLTPVVNFPVSQDSSVYATCSPFSSFGNGDTFETSILCDYPNSAVAPGTVTIQFVTDGENFGGTSFAFVVATASSTSTAFATTTDTVTPTETEFTITTVTVPPTITSTLYIDCTTSTTNPTIITSNITNATATATKINPSITASSASMIDTMNAPTATIDNTTSIIATNNTTNTSLSGGNFDRITPTLNSVANSSAASYSISSKTTFDTTYFPTITSNATTSTIATPDTSVSTTSSTTPPKTTTNSSTYVPVIRTASDDVLYTVPSNSTPSTPTSPSISSNPPQPTESPQPYDDPNETTTTITVTTTLYKTICPCDFDPDSWHPNAPNPRLTTKNYRQGHSHARRDNGYGPPSTTYAGPITVTSIVATETITDSITVTTTEMGTVWTTDMGLGTVSVIVEMGGCPESSSATVAASG